MQSVICLCHPLILRTYQSISSIIRKLQFFPTAVICGASPLSKRTVPTVDNAIIKTNGSSPVDTAISKNNEFYYFSSVFFLLFRTFSATFRAYSRRSRLLEAVHVRVFTVVCVRKGIEYCPPDVFLRCYYFYSSVLLFSLPIYR